MTKYRIGDDKEFLVNDTYTIGALYCKFDEEYIIEFTIDEFKEFCKDNNLKIVEKKL